MMEGIGKYADFLEGFCREVVDHQPEKIGVACMLPGGAVLTGYFGDASYNDKALMGYHMQLDATLMSVMANAKNIVAAAEEQEGEE